MTRHPAEDVLLDLLEGAGDPAARRHAGECAECARRIDEAREMLGVARTADVPEPPLPYWGAFRRSVGARIATEPGRHAAWAWIAPLAAAAALVVALTSGRTQAPSRAPLTGPVLPAWSALPPAEADPSLVVLEGLADETDAGLDEGRGLVPLLAGLSDDESEALVVALSRPGAGGEL